MWWKFDKFSNMLYIVAATFVSPIFIAFSLISLYIALLKAMAHGDELNSDKGLWACCLYYFLNNRGSIKLKSRFLQRHLS